MLGKCARGAVGTRREQLCASLFHVYVRIPSPCLGSSWTDCTEIWCVVRGHVAVCFTQDGIFCTNASVTVTHLSTSIRSRSFIAQKASYWLLMAEKSFRKKIPKSGQADEWCKAFVGTSVTSNSGTSVTSNSWEATKSPNPPPAIFCRWAQTATGGGGRARCRRSNQQ